LTPLFPIAFAALTGAALLLPTPADRLRGALGLPAFALGAASVPYLPGFLGPSLTIWITAALLLLGPGLLLAAVWQAHRRGKLTGLMVTATVVGVAAGLAAGWPTVSGGGAGQALITASAVAGIGWSCWLLGAAIGVARPVRRLDALLPGAPGRAGWGVVLLLLVAAGTRLAWVAFPLWVLSWQPIGVGMGVICLGWAVATGGARMALAAAALATAWSSAEPLDLAWLVLAAAIPVPVDRPRLQAAIAALGIWLATPSLLAAEVLFTVLLVAFATAMLAALADQAESERGASR